VCSPIPGAGDPCDPGDPVCDNGLLCALTGCSVPVVDGGTCSQAGWACSAPVPEGGACAPDQCAPSSLACAFGSCIVANHAGDPCESVCAASPALSCLPSSTGNGNECVSVTFATAGQACDVLHGAICSTLGQCRDSNGATSTTGTCAPALPDDQSCDGGTACLYPALCVGGHCALQPADSCK
jgi:hypothetical protein